MVAQTFVSLHLYGYGTVLAMIQKIFTTDGRRPRSITRFYNGFSVDSMYMTIQKAWRFSLPEVRGTAEPHGGVYLPPHPVPSPIRPHDTHHYSTAEGRAETDRLDWLAWMPLAHHFDSV